MEMTKEYYQPDSSGAVEFTNGVRAQRIPGPRAGAFYQSMSIKGREADPTPTLLERTGQDRLDALAAKDHGPLPPDPDAELVAAIANAIKDEPPGSPVRKLGEALLGQTSAGRVAGRPV